MSNITPIKTAEHIQQQKGLFHKPFFIAPSAQVFAERAIRFDELAAEDPSEWSGYLHLLAQLCRAQQHVLDTHPQTLPPLAQTATLLPTADGAELPTHFYPLFRSLLLELKGKVPAVAQTTLDNLASLTYSDAEELACRVLQGTLSPAEAPYQIWLHAALQIMWTAWAIQLQEDDVPIIEQRSHCPCCGSEAVASIVLINNDLHGLRYQHCPTCNSRWNALRAKCTFCNDQSSIALQDISATPYSALQGARAESCDACHNYRKLFMQQHQQYAEPLADDLASLPLDILMGENGYQRGGHNPFLIIE